MLEQVILFTILMGFLISVLLSPILIPFLRRLKFGQSITPPIVGVPDFF